MKGKGKGEGEKFECVGGIEKEEVEVGNIKE